MKHMFIRVLNASPAIAIGLTVMIFSLVLIDRVSADNTLGELVEQKSMLGLRIEQAKGEYAKISEEKANAQESCNIVLQKAEQMKQLGELNGARRKEIEAIEQKLKTLQSESPLE